MGKIPLSHAREAQHTCRERMYRLCALQQAHGYGAGAGTGQPVSHQCGLGARRCHSPGHDGGPGTRLVGASGQWVRVQGGGPRGDGSGQISLAHPASCFTLCALQGGYAFRDYVLFGAQDTNNFNSKRNFHS